MVASRDILTSGMLVQVVTVVLVVVLLAVLGAMVRFGVVSSRRRRGARARLRQPDPEAVARLCQIPVPESLAAFFREDACVEMMELELVDRSKTPAVRWFIGAFVPLTAVDVREWRKISGVPGVPIADDMDKGMYYLSREGTIRLQSPNVPGRDVMVAPSVDEFRRFSPSRAPDAWSLRDEDFSWDQFFWTATVEVPCWRGFQSRRGPYGTRDAAAPSDGTVGVIVARKGQARGPLEERELALVRWALENNAKMQEALLAALLERYPALREQYAGFAEPDEMPPVSGVDDFRGLVGLHLLHVYTLEKDGAPYVGFELGCTWDSEHGLGVMMHGTRVVEIGGADTAIHRWVAERDAEGR